MSRRKKAGGRYRRKSHTQYYLMPLAALLVCCTCLGLYRTGLADKLEQAVITVAQNDSISDSLVRIILPQGEKPGDAPSLLPQEAVEETSPGGEHPEDTALSPANASDIAEEEGNILPVMVFESIMPELTSNPYGAKEDISPITIDGTAGGYEGSGTVYLRNETTLSIDAISLLRQKSPVTLSGDGVQVLIMHTHGTEAYTPGGNDTYIATDPDRTTDSSSNMIRIGEEVATILEENGIKVIHSTTLNDYPAYNGSYTRALEDITKYIKENPSIKVVIDLHRDAMVSQNGTKYKTVANIDGKDAAQLAFVVGTNQGGLTHNNWEQNLIFQLHIHDRMNTLYPGIMRPLVLRNSRYNQHVTTGSMLLEVGTSGNTLAEALYSARLFAEVLTEILNDG